MNEILDLIVLICEVTEICVKKWVGGNNEPLSQTVKYKIMKKSGASEGLGLKSSYHSCLAEFPVPSAGSRYRSYAGMDLFVT